MAYTVRATTNTASMPSDMHYGQIIMGNMNSGGPWVDPEMMRNRKHQTRVSAVNLRHRRKKKKG